MDHQSIVTLSVILRGLAVLLSIFGAVYPLTSHAVTTGNDLLNSINNTDQAERLWALGFVNGVVDAGQGDYLCAPEGATVGQAKDIVTDFLQKVPSQRHKPAAYIVLAALSMAWPCDKAPEKPTKGGRMNSVRKTT